MIRVAAVPAPPRPRRIVHLAPASIPGMFSAASKRDAESMRSLAGIFPVCLSDLLRGAADQRWVIRFSPAARGPAAARPEPARRLTLVLAESPSRTVGEVVPMGEHDRQLILGLFPDRLEAEPLPPPSSLIRRAVLNGFELTIRCDLRVIR